jgi:hypothetical protein
MGEDDVFDLIQVDGKADEFKCKECDKSYTVAGSVRKHFKAKHKRKDDSNESTKSNEEQLLEEVNESTDDFNPDEDDVYKSTQNGDKTLSAEEIIKLYEDKETSDNADEEPAKETEQTLFPEKELMLQMVETDGKVGQEGNDEKELVNEDNDAMGTAEIERLKILLKKKDEALLEKDEMILDKDIEITTLKDEVESSGKKNDKQSEEIEILIASVNSLEEEKSILKVNVVNESRKVEKLNHTLKKVFKEKECLQKETKNLAKDNKERHESNTEDKNETSLKKKALEKQKEITVLKERNKKLADDLAEEESRQVKENPNNLILTNLLKTRTAEMKRTEKEKENLQKTLTESNSQLKEANDKVIKAESINTRLETEVNNLIEILGKRDQDSRSKPNPVEQLQDVQFFQMDGNPKRCSFNNRAICRNNACRFAHSEIVCKSYSSFGKCDQGNQCPGRHPTGICNKWTPRRLTK